MNLSQARELPLIECLPFRPGRPGFALPLFAHPERTDVRCVQEVDEYRNLIAGFKILEDYVSSNAIPLSGPRALIGGELVHVFFTEDGDPHAGTLNDLIPVMMEFVDRCQNQYAIVLQIRELIGTDQEKRLARVAMREKIARSVDEGAARSFYEGAALRSALWRRLVSTAPNAESAERILRVRSRLSAHLRSDGSVKLDLSALDPRDGSRIDQDRLKIELSAEFRNQTSVPRSEATTRRESSAGAVQWWKPLTRSDAQRKSAGNQRGSITLVQANHKINAQRFFRYELFKKAKWRPAKTRTGERREAASIPFRVNFLGRDLGVLELSVSYAPNREASQKNYTSLLHLGPLVENFKAKDVTGKWLRVARTADGAYTLSITDKLS